MLTLMTVTLHFFIFLLNFLFCVEVELISSAVMVSVPCVSADVEAVAHVRLCVPTVPALPGNCGCGHRVVST